MALPTSPVSSWTQSLDLPSRLFGQGSTDVELYEDDGEFVLTVELPGFDRDEIEVSWYEGRLNISAEHEDSDRGQKRTYHRSFRMPKAIEDDEITARYENGVLEVRLPAAEGATTRGKTIEIEG